jgi:hypothetical protein
MFGVGHLNQLAWFMDLGERLKKADAGICQAALGTGVQELQELQEIAEFGSDRVSTLSLFVLGHVISHQNRPWIADPREFWRRNWVYEGDSYRTGIFLRNRAAPQRIRSDGASPYRELCPTVSIALPSALALLSKLEGRRTDDPI